MKRKSLFILYGAAALVVSGCTNFLIDEKSDYMNQLALKLTRLSASVEATVQYDNPPATIADDVLLRKATEHDQNLLVPFEDYELHLLRGQGHAVLLVCDDGKALLEDAGCTGTFELHRWKSEAPQPCEFTLDVSQVCQ